MNIEVVIRGKVDREYLRFLLGEAESQGFGVRAVRQNPDGLFLPLEFADHVGLLDHIKTPPEVVSEPEREPEPERPTRKRPVRKRTKPEAEAVSEVPTTEDSPWD